MLLLRAVCLVCLECCFQSSTARGFWEFLEPQSSLESQWQGQGAGPGPAAFRPCLPLLWGGAGGWGGAPSTSSAVLCPAPGNRPPLSGPLTPGLVAGAVLADLCPHCPVCHPSFSLPISVLLLPRWLISWVDPGADMLLGRTQASATPHVTPCPHRPSTRTHGLLATLHTGPRAFAHAARLSGDPTAGPSPSSASGHPEPP